MTMKFQRRTVLAIALTAGLLAALNLQCSRPGIGGRTDRVDGVRPAGSELELFYGWPACHCAELFRSDDPGLADRVLRSAPLFVPPYKAGWVSARYIGARAVVLNATFAILGIAIVAILCECDQRGQWPRRAIVAATLIAALLTAGYLIAPVVSVHL